MEQGQGSLKRTVMKDIECPYCGHEQNVDHDDGQNYEQNTKHQMACEQCEKNFVFETEIHFSYSPEKADCLNEGQHDFKMSHTYPTEFSTMICKDCGEKRDLTDEERKERGIGTKQEYFETLKIFGP
jgi:transcription elongation factor Elf1